MMEYKEKAKEKEQLYEVVRSDRNLYSKNLIEKHDEMNELKRKFDITTQQINQLKEELEAKDKALVSKMHDLEKEKREKEKYAIEVQAQESTVEQLKKSAKEKDTNIKKLTAMLSDGDRRIKALQAAYEKAIRDKDVFGTELIRRNDELTLLCEKIKICKAPWQKQKFNSKTKNPSCDY
jgi:chromosome segregation ATPase